jgi:hypothetical protein
MPVVRSSRLAFTFCLLLLGPSWSMAQVGSIPDPPQAPPRDRLPPPRTGNAVVKGKVVDGVTGAPIARARVRLNGPGQHPPVLTDADGQFAFTGVAAGLFSLSADKATYVAGRYPDTQRSLRGRAPAPLKDGQTADVVVQMFRGASISGRVLDAHGDPVEYAEVRVMMARRGQAPAMRSQSQTNDLGEFRVGRLDGGKYLLAVVPRVMNSEDPNGPLNPTPIPVATAMYYPNAMTLDQAQPIVLNRGEVVSGIEFTLGEGMPTVVTGTVVSAEGPLPEVNGGVNARLAGPESMGTFFSGGTGIRPDGSFRIQLAPGEYVLEARLSPRVTANPTANMNYQQRNELFGSIRVSAGSNPVEAVTIVVGRGAAATGRVIFEGNSPVPAAPSGGTTYVPLFGEGPACRQGQATIGSDWTFKVEGLGGTCSAPMPGMLGRWSVKAVMFRGQNIVDRTITFEQGQEYSNLQIVVSDKRPEVELLVAGEDGQPTREYVAIAFPTQKTRWLPRFVRPLLPGARQLSMPPPGIVGGMIGGASLHSTVTAVNGQPSAAAVPPTEPRRDVFRQLSAGEYYIIAVDDIDVDDYTDPAVLERLVPHATRVMVSDEAQVEVQLRRVPIADILR